MVTLGVAPKFPLTVTELFALGFALALALDDAAGLAEQQPATARPPSKNKTMIARRRRMKTSMVVDVSVGPGGRLPAPRCPRVTCRR
jgi:hypothetical protein